MKKSLLLIAMLCLALTGLMALNQVVSPDSPNYDAYKMSLIGQNSTPSTATPNIVSNWVTGDQSKDAPALLIPLDGSFTLAMSPNDDGSSAQIPLGFTFSLYGQPYSSCYINNNGNITFDGTLGSYTSWPFPIGGYPMVAAFFADVDTRGTGQVYYRLEANRMVVIWNQVGYYNSQTDKTNTFEIIMTNGTDPLIGLGNNVCFSYADMQWTTGSASGGSGGFYGGAATVGINKGDNVTSIQSGRFDQPGTAYDGGYGLNDGIDWLDDRDLYLQAAGAATLIVTLSDPVIVTGGIDMPAGLVVTDPTVTAFYATYPLAGIQTINIPVGAGLWRAWIYYTAAWHQADVFPVYGPGTIVFSNVPFSGGKENIPIIMQEESIPLPVELSAFTAVMNAENYVNIQWVTETETNLTGFYIYRSETNVVADAVRLTLLIDPTNTSETHQYSHVDDTLVEEGVYYYWLQVAEMDGSEVFHGPTAVNFSTTIDEPVVPVVTPIAGIRNIYPNPITPYSVISYNLTKGTNVKFQVFNARGQLVNNFDEGFKADGTWNTGWNGKDANGTACPTGLYYIKMIAGKDSFVRKAVVIK